jgi:hypothetical protein
MSAGRTNISNSKNKSWNTPPKYIKLITEFFGKIWLDPCSNEFSMINAEINYTLPTDGLKQTWNYKTVFINPPYGKSPETKTSMYDWILKGIEANKEFGSELLYLIPVATNTKHYKDLIFKNGCGICFLSDTRLRFWCEGEEDKKGAPMSCAMVYFGSNYGKFESIFSNSGKCFKI